MMEIRAAQLSDADEITQVLRRSISELCTADHNNDQVALSSWLANKTPDIVRQWITAKEQRMLVAVLEGQIAGVGAARKTGEITLNYVSPDYRGRGVSTAILRALESYLETQGVQESRLTSTVTARRFYQKAGYVSDPAGNVSNPMQVTTAQDRPQAMWKMLRIS